jgi:DNA-directed RNA polymerase subunit RPC12/RpoP
MKRLLFIAFVFTVLGAAALFAADRLYCKWCGSSNFANIQQLTAGSCSRSPTGRHERYGGAPRAFYVCKYCGAESASFEQLVLSPCSKSPRRYHDAYAGSPNPPYTCIYCGAEFRSLKQLVLSPCRKSPRGYHDV